MFFHRLKYLHGNPNLWNALRWTGRSKSKKANILFAFLHSNSNNRKYKSQHMISQCSQLIPQYFCKLLLKCQHLPCVSLSTHLLYPSIYSSTHPSFHPSITKQMAFQESMSGLMQPPIPTPAISLSTDTPPAPYAYTRWTDLTISHSQTHYLSSWKRQVISLSASWNGCKSKCTSNKSVCLWGSVHKEKPPKRAVCLWSLGPVKEDNWWCFHYKVWGNVGAGAQYECVCMCVMGVGRLTQLLTLWHQPLLWLVWTSHCFQML